MKLLSHKISIFSILITGLAAGFYIGRIIDSPASGDLSKSTMSDSKPSKIESSPAGSPLNQLSEYREQLIKSGMPDDLIPMILYSILTYQNQRKIENLLWPENIPYWKLLGGVTQRDPETRKQIALIQKQTESDFEKILNGMPKHAYEMSDAHLKAKYGDVPKNKIPQLEQMSQDYRNLVMQATSVSTATERIKILSELQHAYELELRSVLAGNEYEQYQLRQSNAAKNVISLIDNIEVTEDNYKKIFYALKEWSSATPAESTDAISMLLNQSNAYSKIEKILPPEDMQKFLANKKDPCYLAVTASLIGFDATPETKLTIWRQLNEFQLAYEQTKKAAVTADITEWRDFYDAISAKLGQVIPDDAVRTLVRTPRLKWISEVQAKAKIPIERISNK